MPSTRASKAAVSHVLIFSVLLRKLLLTARVVPAIFWIARAVVLRMRGVGAQRTAAPRKGPSGRHHRVGALALLHPFDCGAQHVEAVERGAAAPAMAHARGKEQPAPIHHFR